MDLAKELTSAGVAPTGPVSAYPKERHQELMDRVRDEQNREPSGPSVKATKAQMAKNLIQTAGQAVRKGKVSAEVREERYNTCKACPAFNKKSKRCSDCGCFMEAKTWVGGNPDNLCPRQQWSR